MDLIKEVIEYISRVSSSFRWTVARRGEFYWRPWGGPGGRCPCGRCRAYRSWRFRVVRSMPSRARSRWGSRPHVAVRWRRA